jgi:YVTN family beta-propeller protein
LQRAALHGVSALSLDGLPNADAVSVIDTAGQRLIKNITVGPGAAAVAITPNGKKVYVASADDSLWVINTARDTLSKKIVVGFGTRPTDVAMAKNGSAAYVINAQRNSISVVDTSTDTVTSTIRAASLPRSIAVLIRCAPGVVASRDGHLAYVINAPGSQATALVPPTDGGFNAPI